MENKHNIEELKHLLPDLITGQISAEDKRELESAIENSSELRADYAVLKSTFGIVESVKSVEPPPEYWNSLLPRIHRRIEEKEAESFSWDKIASIWKVLVPIAAVILIAVIYYLAVPSKNEFTDKEKIEKIVKDTSRVDSKKDTKLPEITNDDKNTNDIKKNIENEKNNIIRKYNRTGNDIVKDNMKINDEKKRG
jgi:anti-sigma-K factor RskA